MNPPFYRPLPAKLRVYEALHNLNRGFEATLLSLEQLERLGMFRLENLNAFKVTLEHTRAEANEELIHVPDDEDEETLAAIDEGIRDVEAGRTVPAEDVPKLLSQWTDR